MTRLLRLASEFERLAQQFDPVQSAQLAIRNWLHMYSVYPTDSAFVNALKVMQSHSRHTAEELQSIIPTLISGPTEHSPQAKAGWKDKVVPVLQALESGMQKQASVAGSFEVLADAKVLYSGDDLGEARQSFSNCKARFKKERFANLWQSHCSSS